MINTEQLNWKKQDGLIPAIIQEANSGKVLMLGYMNQTALTKTMGSKRVTFYSRSREKLWTKGETSGYFLDVVDILADCDFDSILVLVNSHGPACHEGLASCFHKDNSPPWTILFELEALIAKRNQTRPQDSYTSELLNNGIARIAQKVGEESVETVIAAMIGNNHHLCEELGDLLYHILVLLCASKLSLNDVLKVLESRINI